VLTEVAQKGYSPWHADLNIAANEAYQVKAKIEKLLRDKP